MPRKVKVFKLSPEETRRAINELARIRTMARWLAKRGKAVSKRVIEAGGGCSQKWEARISQTSGCVYTAHKSAATRVVLKRIPADAQWAKP